MTSLQYLVRIIISLLDLLREMKKRFYKSKTKSDSIIIITGGNVGLFTGMSILSICEIVFWLARFVSGIAGRSINRT